MKKLTKKEIDLTLDLIQIAILNIGDHQENDDEFSVYRRLGKCEVITKNLINFIRNGYDDFIYKKYKILLQDYYEDLLIALPEKSLEKEREK